MPSQRHLPNAAQFKLDAAGRGGLSKRLDGFEHVVVARAYLTRFQDDYAAINDTYREFFPAGELPARTCVGVTGLAYDARVEIDLVARRPA